LVVCGKEKFQLYRSLPSLEEYVLIDSQRIAAEVFRKSERGFWSLMSEGYTREGSIELDGIGLTLPVRNIYNQIEDLGF
jgi:Uma2 family endonuclease